MEVSYDPKHNIAYIRLREKGGEVETVRVSDEIQIDLAPDGSVYGIELLDANRQLARGDEGKLLVQNEESGERHELDLAKGA